MFKRKGRESKRDGEPMAYRRHWMPLLFGCYRNGAKALKAFCKHENKESASTDAYKWAIGSTL